MGMPWPEQVLALLDERLSEVEVDLVHLLELGVTLKNAAKAVGGGFPFLLLREKVEKYPKHRLRSKVLSPKRNHALRSRSRSRPHHRVSQPPRILLRHIAHSLLIFATRK